MAQYTNPDLIAMRIKHPQSRSATQYSGLNRKSGSQVVAMVGSWPDTTPYCQIHRHTDRQQKEAKVCSRF